MITFDKPNKRVSEMRAPLAALREPAVVQNRQSIVLYQWMFWT